MATMMSMLYIITVTDGPEFLKDYRDSQPTFHRMARTLPEITAINKNELQLDDIQKSPDRQADRQMDEQHQLIEMQR